MEAAAQIMANPAAACPTRSAPTRSVCAGKDTTRGMANVLLVSIQYLYKTDSQS